MDLRWEILAGYGPLFVSGLWMTIELTLVAIGAGLLLGVLFGLVSSSADAPTPAVARARLGPEGWRAGSPSATSPSFAARRCSCRSCWCTSH